MVSRQRKQSKCCAGRLMRCCKLDCVKRMLPHRNSQQWSTRNQTEKRMWAPDAALVYKERAFPPSLDAQELTVA